MTITSLERITAQIAELPVADRVAPQTLGYGTDLSCTTDVTSDLAEVNPQSNTAVGQAIARRLITPRGGLTDDQAYGLDLRGYCNRGVTVAETRTLAALVRSEALKDQRVVDATVNVTYASNTLKVSLQLRLESVSNGVFPLTFFVTADGVELVASIDQ